MLVYLISSYINDVTLYKIGFTKRSVEQRLKEMKTGNAADLNVVYTFESKYSSKIEASLKTSYQHINISGEWFLMNDNDVKNFKYQCELLHDNIYLLNK